LGYGQCRLRVSDSIADYIFYLCVLYAVVLRHWQVVRERLWLLGVVLCFEAGRMLFDWMKYGKMASYHSYAAKVWGILLASAVIAVLCFDHGAWLVTCALAWGIVCNLESLAMSLMLPEWAHDVKTLGQAIVLRREMLTERTLQVK
jgi:CDP-diacylglycerol--glycerol-3-phosphate 3-phosphatidyltransferase